MAATTQKSKPKAARPEEEEMATGRSAPTGAGNALGRRTDDLGTGRAGVIQTDDLSTAHHSVLRAGRGWWQIAWIGGMGATVALYSLMFVVVAGWISLTNTLQYGPVHTTYTVTKLSGQDATIISSNQAGDITITVKIHQNDGSLLIRSYQGPALSADTWNGDLGSIVVTSAVAGDGQTIKVSLLGSVNYLHLFFVRPSATFSLVPDKQAGYKVATP